MCCKGCARVCRAFNKGLVHLYMCMYNVQFGPYIQWNPSNPDTTGPEESVLIREVSLFQGLKST